MPSTCQGCPLGHFSPPLLLLFSLLLLEDMAYECSGLSQLVVSFSSPFNRDDLDEAYVLK